MKDLKEYINESTGITADKLKELALSKADEGMGDGWIYFKKPVVTEDDMLKLLAISDDGKTLLYKFSNEDMQLPVSVLDEEIIVWAYDALKKL